MLAYHYELIVLRVVYSVNYASLSPIWIEHSPPPPSGDYEFAHNSSWLTSVNVAPNIIIDHVACCILNLTPSWIFWFPFSMMLFKILYYEHTPTGGETLLSSWHFLGKKTHIYNTTTKNTAQQQHNPDFQRDVQHNLRPARLQPTSNYKPVVSIVCRRRWGLYPTFYQSSTLF